jgi:hypothetical protein
MSSQASCAADIQGDEQERTRCRVYCSPGKVSLPSNKLVGDQLLYIYFVRCTYLESLDLDLRGRRVQVLRNDNVGNAFAV